MLCGMYCTQSGACVFVRACLNRPHGKLKVSIRACWLKDAKVDADAMTEVSGSQYTDNQSHRSHGRGGRHKHDDWGEQDDAEEFTEQVRCGKPQSTTTTTTDMVTGET